MKVTICTTIKDERTNSLLGPYAHLLGQVRGWIFREEHIKGRKKSEVRSAAQVKFGLKSRQANSIQFDLKQEVATWKGTLQWRQSNLNENIKLATAKIAQLEKDLAGTKDWLKAFPKGKKIGQKIAELKFAIHGKKRRLQTMRDRLKNIKIDLNAGVPKLCFGGRELLRQGKTDEWRSRRASRIYLVGSKDEKCGNNICQWDGESLKIRMPNLLGGESALLEGVRFRHGQEELLAAILTGKCVTWLLFRDGNVWKAHATFERDPAKITTDKQCGIIGIDLNVDHLAVVFIDRFGNPTRRERLPFPAAGTPAGAASAVIGDSVAQICAWAKETGFSVAVEALNFDRKKASLREQGRKHARRLSGFAYSAFGQMMESRCQREGVEKIEVNPAYTSQIGKLKYARGRAMSAHQAAALVIGRRAMGFGERFVCMLKVALDGPGRNRPRLDWGRWRNARPMANAGGRRDSAVRPRGRLRGQADRGADLVSAGLVDVARPPGLT